jgi:hypothetical protein
MKDKIESLLNYKVKGTEDHYNMSAYNMLNLLQQNGKTPATTIAQGTKLSSTIAFLK